jgi:hypothetical protein
MTPPDHTPLFDRPGTSASPSPPPAPSAPIAPLKNPRYRHISRSAAKRESVQLLGSIKDLQLHFARAGLVEDRPGSGAGTSPLSGSIEEGGEDEENTPPVIASSAQRARKPWKEVELPRIDAEQARREARSAVGRVRSLWDLRSAGSVSNILSPSASMSFPASPTTQGGRTRRKDTTVVLVDTAKAIRRVRDLALSSSAGKVDSGRRVSGSALVPSKTNRSGFSTPSRPSGVISLPRAVSYPASATSPRPPNQPKEDGLAELRKAALDVLAGLRTLEESLRVDPIRGECLTASPVDCLGGDARACSPEDPGSVSSDSHSGMSDFTRPTSTGLTDVAEEDFDEEDEYNINALVAEEAVGPTQTWEERIVSEAREYRDLNEEGEKLEGLRDAVKRWIGVVEGLFGVQEGSPELEDWAREDWTGRPLGESSRPIRLDRQGRSWQNKYMRSC